MAKKADLEPTPSVDEGLSAAPLAPAHHSALDFYGPARQNAFAGYAALSAGDRADAAAFLAAALDGLTEQDGKQRTVVLADLASAHQDDIERAADYLNRAVDALSADSYRTGFDRIRAGRSMLRECPDGARLDQRLDALLSDAGYHIQVQSGRGEVMRTNAVG